MRIALAVEGTRGDVHPMFSLGNAFQAAGHDVVFCGPRNFATFAATNNFEYREVGSDTREFLGKVATAISSRGLGANRAQFEYFKDSMHKQFTRLPDATEDADLILGAGVQFAGGSVAELHGIPYRYVMFCPVMLPSQEHSPPFIPSQALPPWANKIAWRMLLGPFDVLTRFALNRARKKYLGLGGVQHGYTHILSEHPILATDPLLAPVPAEFTMPVEQLGCIHDHDLEPLPEKLEDFLAQGSPPVYIGFGSMTDATPVATTRLILKAIEAVGCRAIVSEGWAGLGEGALPENVIRTGPVSHASLFPRCAAVVHHGGAGTTTRVAQAGVPQVIVPHLLDQYWWGKRIMNMGLAPTPLPRARLTANRLSELIASVLGNEFLSTRAREVGKQIAPDLTPRNAADKILSRLPV